MELIIKSCRQNFQHSASGTSRERKFLSESFMINVIALVLALLMVTLVRRGFNNMIKYDLSLSYLFQKGLSGYNITIALIALIITGILVSGFYPAFVLSSFKPILV